MDYVLTNLRAAFERKKNLNEYETMPDPVKDDSFRRFIRDEWFQQLLRDPALTTGLVQHKLDALV